MKIRLIILSFLWMVPTYAATKAMQADQFGIKVAPIDATHSDARAEKRLKDLLHGIKSLRAQFNQVIVDENGSTLQKSHGQMAILKPGKFYWEVTEPVKQVVVMNEKVLWVYDVDLEQATKRSSQVALADSPAALLSDNVNSISKKFTVKLISGINNRTHFILTPKAKNKAYKSIELIFAGAEINALRFIDKMGQKTNIDLNRIQLNPPIRSSVFNFEPPAHIDIIDDMNPNG